MKQTISACLVIKNEEKQLEECLKNIKDAVDEIVVLHDGKCLDKSIEIAKKYADVVLINPDESRGSAEFLRGKAYKAAHGDWILTIDADERLSEGLRKNLRELALNRYVDAYSFLWPYYSHEGSQLEKNPKKYKKIFFRKNQLYHIGSPHMVGETYGKTEKRDFVLEHHYSLDMSRGRLSADIRKNKKRAENFAEYLVNSWEKIPVFNASVNNKQIRSVRLAAFVKNHPYLGIITLPLGSLILRTFKKRYPFGKIGFANTIDYPIYLYYLCLFTIKKQRQKNKRENKNEQ